MGSESAQDGLAGRQALTEDSTHRNTTRFYRKLPLSMSSIELPPQTPRWRIELAGLGQGAAALGLDILGDTVIGRGRVGAQPVDLDLDPYNAIDLGVSRRHALLRPTIDHLYIIDLGSTNGTMHNGLPLGPGITRPLQHNDTVTLGQLSFIIKVIEDPLSKVHDTGRLPEIDDSDAPLTPRAPMSWKGER